MSCTLQEYGKTWLWMLVAIRYHGNFTFFLESLTKHCFRFFRFALPSGYLSHLCKIHCFIMFESEFVHNYLLLNKHLGLLNSTIEM